MNRRKFIIGTGAVTAAAVGGAALMASPVAAEVETTFEISDPPAVETADGSLEYVALTDYNARVDWIKFSDDIRYIETRKYLTIDEVGGDNVVDYRDADRTLTETSADVATQGDGGNPDGADGHWILIADENTIAFTVAEGVEYSNPGDHASPPGHDPFDASELEAGDEGSTREFTVTVEQEFDLYHNESDENPTKTVTASDDFTLTVVNEEPEASMTGGADGDAA